MRKRVELVAALFREAGKAIHAMPLLLIQPIYTLIALVVLCVGFLYGAVWIESAGTATIENGNQSVFFKKDTFLLVRNFQSWARPHRKFMFLSRLPGGIIFSSPSG